MLRLMMIVDRPYFGWSLLTGKQSAQLNLLNE